MGLCSEQVDHKIILPRDQCAQHRDKIKLCMYEEGKGKITFISWNFNSISILGIIFVGVSCIKLSQ